MANEEKQRYSAEELKEFEAIILKKLENILKQNVWKNEPISIWK